MVIDKIYKLSNTQKGVLFLSYINNEHAGTYLLSTIKQFSGFFDRDSFEASWRYIIERHEALRACFIWKEVEEPVQVILQEVALPIDWHDWRHLSKSEQDKRFFELIDEDRSRGLDPASAPLLRLTLVQMDDEEYRVILTMHHLIVDGWSLPIVFREFIECYRAFSSGQEPRLEPVRPYEDYITWLNQQDQQASEAYWRSALSGLLEPTRLGVGNSAKPTDQSVRQVIHSHRLTRTLTQALQDFARRNRVTLNTVFQAAWALLLSRHSETNDIVFGATTSGRPPELRGVEDIVGMFINTLPVRVRINPDCALVDWLHQLQIEQTERLEHQYSPLVDIHNWSDIPQSSPLFECIFMYENYPNSITRDGNSSKFCVTDSKSIEFTNYPLGIQILPKDNIQINFLYDSKVYFSSTMERLVVHLERLLAAMASADPEQKISTLSLLDEAERHQVLEEWNATAADYPQDRCLHELIAEQAARQPDAVAVEFEGQCLSYGELEARANQLAHHLRTLGVGPEVIVGLCVDRSAEMVVSLLAILKAGGAYLPLDPAYPPDRLAFMLQDAGASLVVCDDAHSGLVSDHPLVCLQADAEIIRQYPQSSPDVTVDAENLAYVTYTSGSTGHPKGVMIRHGGLNGALSSLTAVLELTAGDVLAAVTNLTFDIATLEILAPLILGGRCVLVTRSSAADGLALTNILKSSRVTVLQATPATWYLLLETGGIPSGLRKILCGGEALSRDLAGGLTACHEHVWNLYGPSETTIWSALHKVTSGKASVPIGHPIWNTQLYVLDGGLEPVPVGVSGELYIGGVGLARGYLGRPDLTAERFVPDPFGSAGGRLYRTGDRVYRRADGALEFLGRYDHQVKLRGYRIETGEIEAALTSHPSVGQAAVLLRADGPGEGRLVAYVVGDASAGDLRAHLQQTLPDYMVPAAFVTLSALPLTPNGKLDRKALPEPDDSGLVRKAYIAPRTPVEEMLTSIWAEVLGVTQVGVEDNFFDLGGHSLLAMQVMARVGQAFAVEIPLKALFEAPCVKDLAAAVELALGLGRTMEDLPLDPVDRSGALKLSHSQERLWFLDQLAPEQSAYNVSGAVRLNGALDVPSLERAFAALIERHESLRTRIVEEEGVGYQVIDPPADFLLKITDVDGLSSEQLKAHMQDLTAARFDLSTGPLFRAELLRLAADRHVLVVSIHHIVSDAWSIGVLVRELGELYAAQCEERPADLPTLPVQYADYAAWQRRWLEGERLEGQLSYWCDKLQELPTLDLPTDHPRPAVMSGHGARIEVTFPAELSGALTALSQREGVTLFMVLLAAFQVLLSRHSEQNDVVVGAPVAGRRRPELEGLIGFFVNTLVLRGNLSDDPSVHDLLVRTRELALEAYGHQDVPFERLVEALQPQRDLSRHPLFQAMLVLQNAPGDAMALPGLSVQSEPLTGNTAKFDLTLSLSETREGLRGRLEYSTDLFEASTMERLVVHLERLLAAMASADPEQKISTLSLLDEAERHQVLEEWNATAADYPQDRCLHELIAEQVARQPDAVAVEFEGQCLSYGELEARANQLAHHLRTLGVGPEVIVGLCVDRSAEMVVSLLAILKAGGAYLPLDPAYPPDRLAFMLQDAGASLVVCDDAHSGLVSDHPLVCLQADAEIIRQYPQSSPDVTVDAENLAYVIYTSGSTGHPKGVMIRHGGLNGALSSLTAVLELTAGDVLAAVTNLTFDIATLEILAPLILGGRCVLVTRSSAADGLALTNILKSSRVTVLQATPTTWYLLLETGGIPSGLRKILCGGEALSRDLAGGLTACHEHVWNLYGPSETTIWSALHKVTSGKASVPIGHPIWNTQLYVLDGGLEPVPVGVSGELYIGGVGLARGYLGRPDLTAERFVPDPFGSAGGRLYRTGDRVCRRADGALEFLGRYDHQVKLRGYRIETGEIEAALTSHPSVGQAAVLLRADGPGEGRLVAYVVGDASAGDLRAHLQQTLPDYMVPAAFVTLSALPLTPNGKLDRKALPEPDDSGLVRKAYIAPRTPVEEMLTSIWAEVLGVTQVGVEDNFFDLGGHSLLAMQVMARVGQAFAVEIPLKALFEAPCVKDLAAAVELALGLGRTMEDLPLDPVDRSGALKLSYEQTSLWHLHQFREVGAAYNVSGAVRLNGALDVPSLERAFAALIERHESLRTRIVEEEGVGYQVIDPPADFLLKITDVDGLSSEQLKAHMQDLTAARFDLSTGPLFRAELLRLAADRHVLVVSIHHIVSDAWSIGVLVRELGELYAAQCEERPADLPTLPVQYADYAAWQRRWLEGERLEGQLSYWCDKLQELPTLDLPTDHPRPAVMSGHGARIEVTFPAELSGALTALSQREGVTLFMVLLAAFQVLLSRHSEQNDVVVGAPVAGRRRPELEGLIGFFVNTLVLRGNLSDNPSVHDLLVRTRELALEAYGHQDVPFERLVEALQPQRDLSRHPLFQAMLVLQNAPGDAMALPGLSVQSEPLTGNTAKFDLTLSLSETREGLRGRLEYSTDLFEASTMERLVVHLERLLAAMASADPEQKISTLSLLDEAERHQVLEEWNATAADYPQDRCLHELIAEQAARQPDAVAVEFEGQCLSYGELEARANQLAHHLRTLGVGPEVIVGLCVDRSAEMVVSLLAILKAGGAYLPLDPAYPPDRLAFMLQDAGASLVVCDDAHSGLVSDHPLVCLQADAEIIRQYPQSSPDVTVDAENLAYVIYTSGSTGRPKGVMIRHNGVANYMSWANKEYNKDFGTGAPVDTSIGTDLTVQTIFLPLIGGATTYIVNQRDALENWLTERINKNCYSFLAVTSARTVNLQSVCWPNPNGAKIGTVILGGEPLFYEHLKWWPQNSPQTKIVNEYGPTETVIACSWYLVGSQQADHNAVGIVPIGYPIWNTQLYVLDGGLEPVPVGVSGELYIGGVGLARGYLGRPDLTAERFVPDPFGSAGGRLYRTGDRVCRRADGALEFLGRYDHQVKLRGYRIETGEIEAALTSHPSVGQAAVLLRADGPGEGRLVAYVVGDASAGDLRAHLQQTLPDYMVPAAFVTLSALPLTSNGKLDRKALPEPDDSGLVRKAYIAPRTPVEEMLTSIWAEVLGVTQVGVEDNFFDLGGDSILALQVISRAKQRGLGLQVRDIFTNQSVIDLSKVIKTPHPERDGQSSNNYRRPNLLEKHLQSLLDQME